MRLVEFFKTPRSVSTYRPFCGRGAGVAPCLVQAICTPRRSGLGRGRFSAYSAPLSHETRQIMITRIRIPLIALVLAAPTMLAAHKAAATARHRRRAFR